MRARVFFFQPLFIYLFESSSARHIRYCRTYVVVRAQSARNIYIRAGDPRNEINIKIPAKTSRISRVKNYGRGNCDFAVPRERKRTSPRLCIDFIRTSAGNFRNAANEFSAASHRCRRISGTNIGPRVLRSARLGDSRRGFPALPSTLRADIFASTVNRHRRRRRSLRVS